MKNNVIKVKHLKNENYVSTFNCVFKCGFVAFDLRKVHDELSHKHLLHCGAVEAREADLDMKTCRRFHMENNAQALQSWQTITTRTISFSHNY